MAEKGTPITEQEAEYTITAIKDWTKSSYTYIRRLQQQDQVSAEADRIDKFIKNSTPYKGEIYRGVTFDSEADAMYWIKENQGNMEQNAHASWTSSKSIGENFAYKGSYRRQPVLIKSVNKTGASIRSLSSQVEENEVIVPKGARHRVKSVTKQDDLILVEVEEV